jgi:EGF domain-specific O-GlcNAc transferase
MFWSQGDFGYIKEKLTEMKDYCKGDDISNGDGHLECVDHLRMCRGRNLYFDFKDLNSANSVDRYRENLFPQPMGQVGAKCKLDKELLIKNGDHKSPLQSWYAELEKFTEFKESPFDNTNSIDQKCDIIITEPTILIKLDAGVNMYHHFCDFINLYVTQHANGTFQHNVNIVLWDTSGSDYWSFFSDMWKVFSTKKPIHLKDYDKKRVCFRNVLFSFLARMRFGLFYNMPLVSGCQKTALFRYFSIKHFFFDKLEF